MMDVITVKYRREDRRVENPFHSLLPRFAISRSSRIC